MKGLYDQIVEQHRDLTQPPFKCRNCGGTEFREWWNQPDCSDIDEESIRYENGGLSYDFHNYATSHSCDAGDTIDFWCLNCEDHADTLEELVGISSTPPPPLLLFAVALLEPDTTVVGSEGLQFQTFWRAEDAEHAREQAIDGFPNANVLAIGVAPTEA